MALGAAPAGRKTPVDGAVSEPKRPQTPLVDALVDAPAFASVQPSIASRRQRPPGVHAGDLAAWLRAEGRGSADVDAASRYRAGAFTGRCSRRNWASCGGWRLDGGGRAAGDCLDAGRGSEGELGFAASVGWRLSGRYRLGQPIDPGCAKTQWRQHRIETSCAARPQSRSLSQAHPGWTRCCSAITFLGIITVQMPVNGLMWLESPCSYKARMASCGHL